MTGLLGEDERRKAIARNAVIVDAMAEKRALAARHQALASWKAELERRHEGLEHAVRNGLTNSKFLDVSLITEAENAVSQLENWIAKGLPPTEREIAKVKEQVAEFAAANRVAPNTYEAEW